MARFFQVFKNDRTFAPEDHQTNACRADPTGYRRHDKVCKVDEDVIGGSWVVSEARHAEETVERGHLATNFGKRMKGLYPW